ncbi:MAG TPA: hypothetical protein VGL94_02320 [Ktedonobacteraceae bacterium]
MRDAPANNTRSKKRAADSKSDNTNTRQSTGPTLNVAKTIYGRSEIEPTGSVASSAKREAVDHVGTEPPEKRQKIEPTGSAVSKREAVDHVGTEPPEKRQKIEGNLAVMGSVSKLAAGVLSGLGGEWLELTDKNSREPSEQTSINTHDPINFQAPYKRDKKKK